MKQIKAVLIFLLGLSTAVGLAFAIPEWGASGGVLQSQITAKLAVVFIFFFQGLVLPIEEIHGVFRKVRVHTFVQLSIFIGYPILVFLAMWPLKGQMNPDIWLGFIYLSVLPTTVSTAVVYSTTAGGNPAVATFNVATANVIGIFIVPVVMAWIVSTKGVSIPIAPLLMRIALLLFLPMLVGQILRGLSSKIREFVAKRRRWANRINTFMVYFIIYCVFSNAVMTGGWESLPREQLLIVLGLCVAFLCVAKSLSFAGVRFFRFSRADGISAFFCSAQKGLAAAVPMGESIFSGTDVTISLVLLPIMLYQPLMLFVGGIIAGVLHREA
ncbi:bile acid:sodium symporter family protein [Rubellicoccus peritrichatus]|uniref:Bile acid:sodium symporter family protein n=1 Tax=Rubellicoccus peritrichatus TaxID=3080537 RepID=A0AAQ3L8W0_9BACT|nr:bile acid:sodium symporter family protein [Puniceicoccus sp. CR14]WOO41804.1 bile acid:sodium symporter family protein [Puniceicoccus sp. CR14]